MKTNTTNATTTELQISPLATTAKAITIAINQIIKSADIHNLIINEVRALSTLATRVKSAKKEGNMLRALELGEMMKPLKKKINDVLKKANSDLLKSQKNAYTFSGVREYIQLNIFTLFSFGYLKLDKNTDNNGNIEYIIKVESRRPTIKEIGEMLPDFSIKLFDGLVNALCGDLAMWDVNQKNHKLNKEEYKNLLKLTLNLDGVTNPSIKGLKNSINEIMGYLYKGVKPFTTKATLLKIRNAFIKGDRVYTFDKKSMIELLPQILNDYCNSRTDEYTFELTKAQQKLSGYNGKIVTVVTETL